MKTIVSFLCSDFPIPDCETPCTPGKELVDAIVTGLLRRGFVDHLDEAVEELGGWSLCLVAHGLSFSLVLNIAGLGKSRDTRWVVRVQRAGIPQRIASLFFGKAAADKPAAVLDLVCVAIDGVLRVLGATDIRWWDDQGFEHALGAPRVDG